MNVKFSLILLVIICECTYLLAQEVFCKIGEYKRDQMTCLPCNSECKSCFGQNIQQCIDCKYSFENGICTDKCKGQNIFLNDLNICEKSSVNFCMKAYSKTICEECESGYSLNFSRSQCISNLKLNNVEFKQELTGQQIYIDNYCPNGYLKSSNYCEYINTCDILNEQQDILPNCFGENSSKYYHQLYINFFLKIISYLEQVQYPILVIIPTNVLISIFQQQDLKLAQFYDSMVVIYSQNEVRVYTSQFSLILQRKFYNQIQSLVTFDKIIYVFTQLDFYKLEYDVNQYFIKTNMYMQLSKFSNVINFQQQEIIITSDLSNDQIIFFTTIYGKPTQVFRLDASQIFDSKLSEQLNRLTIVSDSQFVTIQIQQNNVFTIKSKINFKNKSQAFLFIKCEIINIIDNNLIILYYSDIQFGIWYEINGETNILKNYDIGQPISQYLYLKNQNLLAVYYSQNVQNQIKFFELPILNIQKLQFSDWKVKFSISSVIEPRIGILNNEIYITSQQTLYKTFDIYNIQGNLIDKIQTSSTQIKRIVQIQNTLFAITQDNVLKVNRQTNSIESQLFPFCQNQVLKYFNNDFNSFHIEAYDQLRELSLLITLSQQNNLFIVLKKGSKFISQKEIISDQLSGLSYNNKLIATTNPSERLVKIYGYSKNNIQVNQLVITISYNSLEIILIEYFNQIKQVGQHYLIAKADSNSSLFLYVFKNFKDQAKALMEVDDNQNNYKLFEIDQFIFICNIQQKIAYYNISNLDQQNQLFNTTDKRIIQMEVQQNSLIFALNDLTFYKYELNQQQFQLEQKQKFKFIKNRIDQIIFDEDFNILIVNDYDQKRNISSYHFISSKDFSFIKTQFPQMQDAPFSLWTDQINLKSWMSISYKNSDILIISIVSYNPGQDISMKLLLFDSNSYNYYDHYVSTFQIKKDLSIQLLNQETHQFTRFLQNPPQQINGNFMYQPYQYFSLLQKDRRIMPLYSKKSDQNKGLNTYNYFLIGQNIYPSFLSSFNKYSSIRVHDNKTFYIKYFVLPKQGWLVQHRSKWTTDFVIIQEYYSSKIIFQKAFSDVGLLFQSQLFLSEKYNTMIVFTQSRAYIYDLDNLQQPIISKFKISQICNINFNCQCILSKYDPVIYCSLSGVYFYLEDRFLKSPSLDFSSPGEREFFENKNNVFTLLVDEKQEVLELYKYDKQNFQYQYVKLQKNDNQFYQESAMAFDKLRNKQYIFRNNFISFQTGNSIEILSYAKLQNQIFFNSNYLQDISGQPVVECSDSSKRMFLIFNQKVESYSLPLSYDSKPLFQYSISTAFYFGFCSDSFFIIIDNLNQRNQTSIKIIDNQNQNTIKKYILSEYDIKYEQVSDLFLQTLYLQQKGIIILQNILISIISDFVAVLQPNNEGYVYDSYRDIIITYSESDYKIGYIDIYDLSIYFPFNVTEFQYEKGIQIPINMYLIDQDQYFTCYLKNSRKIIFQNYISKQMRVLNLPVDYFISEIIPLNNLDQNEKCFLYIMPNQGIVLASNDLKMNTLMWQENEFDEIFQQADKQNNNIYLLKSNTLIQLKILLNSTDFVVERQVISFDSCSIGDIFKVSISEDCISVINFLGQVFIKCLYDQCKQTDIIIPPKELVYFSLHNFKKQDQQNIFLVAKSSLDESIMLLDMNLIKYALQNQFQGIQQVREVYYDEELSLLYLVDMYFIHLIRISETPLNWDIISILSMKRTSSQYFESISTLPMQTRSQFIIKKISSYFLAVISDSNVMIHNLLPQSIAYIQKIEDSRFICLRDVFYLEKNSYSLKILIIVDQYGIYIYRWIKPGNISEIKFIQYYFPRIQFIKLIKQQLEQRLLISGVHKWNIFEANVLIITNTLNKSSKEKSQCQTYYTIIQDKYQQIDQIKQILINNPEISQINFMVQQQGQIIVIDRFFLENRNVSISYNLNGYICYLQYLKDLERVNQSSLIGLKFYNGTLKYQKELQTSLTFRSFTNLDFLLFEQVELYSSLNIVSSIFIQFRNVTINNCLIIIYGNQYVNAQFINVQLKVKNYAEFPILSFLSVKQITINNMNILSYSSLSFNQDDNESEKINFILKPSKSIIEINKCDNVNINSMTIDQLQTNRNIIICQQLQNVTINNLKLNQIIQIQKQDQQRILQYDAEVMESSYLFKMYLIQNNFELSNVEIIDSQIQNFLHYNYTTYQTIESDENFQKLICTNCRIRINRLKMKNNIFKQNNQQQLAFIYASSPLLKIENMEFMNVSNLKNIMELLYSTKVMIKNVTFENVFNSWLFIKSSYNQIISVEILLINACNQNFGFLHIDNSFALVNKMRINQNLQPKQKIFYISDSALKIDYPYNFLYDKPIIIQNCLFQHITCSQCNGAAISVNSVQKINIINSIFRENTSKYNGGAIQLNKVILILNQVYMTKNKAELSGGAIYSLESDIFIQDSSKKTLIQDNKSLIGGGIRYFTQNNVPLNLIIYKNNIINNNAQIYGNNIASYPVQFKINQFLSNLSKVISSISSVQQKVILTWIDEEGNNIKFSNFQQIMKDQQALSQYQDIIQEIKSYLMFYLRSDKIKFNYQSESQSYQAEPLIIGSEEYIQLQSIFLFQPNSSSQFDIINKYQKSQNSMPQQVINQISNIQANFRKCQQGEVFTRYNEEYYECSKCTNQTYSLQEPQSFNQICKECPIDAKKCDGNIILADDGFWIEKETGDIIKCENLPSKCITSDTELNKVCSEGGFGPRCESCDYKNEIWKEAIYGKNSNYQCVRCEINQIGSDKILTYIVLFAGLVGYQIYLSHNINKFSESIITGIYLKQSRIMFIGDSLNRKSFGFIVKSLVNYFQLAIILLQFNFRLPYSIQKFTQFTSSPLILTQYNLDCIIIKYFWDRQLEMVYVRLFWSLANCLSIIFFSLLLITAYYKVKLTKLQYYQSNLKRYLMTTVYYIYIVYYPSLITVLINTVMCQKIGSTYYIIADNQYECYERRHIIISYGFCIPMLIILVIVIPVQIFLKLRNNKDKLYTINMYKQYSIFYAEYKPKYYYWELILLIQKSLIYFGISFFSENAVAKGAFLCVVMIIYIRILYKEHPYQKRIMNNISIFQNFTLMFCYQLGIINLSTNDAEFKYAALLSVLLLNLCIILYFVFSLISQKINYNERTFYFKAIQPLHHMFPNVLGRVFRYKRCSFKSHKNWQKIYKYLGKMRKVYEIQDSKRDYESVDLLINSDEHNEHHDKQMTESDQNGIIVRPFFQKKYNNNYNCQTSINIKQLDEMGIRRQSHSYNQAIVLPEPEELKTHKEFLKSSRI